MKKRHIVLKTIGVLFLALVVAIGAFAYKNRRYVSAVIDGMRYSEADLGKKHVESAEKTISEIDNQVSVSLRELTQEEKDKIASGELSQTAIMAQIIAEAVGIQLDAQGEGPVVGENNQSGNAAVSSDNNNAQQGGESPAQNSTSPSQGGVENSSSEQGGNSTPSVSKPTESVPPQTTPKKSSDELVAEAVSQLYSLQGQYTAKLEALVSSAKSSYHQQKNEIGPAAAKKNLMSQYSSQVVSMENDCDAKVEAVLSKLSSELGKIGADTGIVSTLRDAYNSEKSIQRAAYVNKYAK